MFGFSPLSSAPLSSLSGKIFSVSVSETLSASDSNNNFVLVDSRLTESNTSTDSSTNQIDFVSVITETRSATDSSTNQIDFVSAITETRSATDSESYTTTYGSAITETGSSTDIQYSPISASLTETSYSTDVSIIYKSLYGITPEYTITDLSNIITDISPFMGPNGIGGSQGSIINGNVKRGIGFTSSKTAQLGTVWMGLNGSSGTSTSFGAVELWSLSSAGGSLVSLLASFPITTSPQRYFDFSTQPGAALTAGSSYCILVSTASDWAFTIPTTVGYVGINYPRVNNYAFADYYNTLIDSSYSGLYNYVGTGAVGSAGSVTGTQFNTTTYKASGQVAPLVIIKYAAGSSIIDTVATQDSYYTFETVSASNAQTNTNTANGFITNRSPFLDTTSTAVPTISATHVGVPQTQGWGKGIKFIANKTQTLSNISVGAYSVYNNLLATNPPQTKGSVQLWQLSNNTLSGNPYTLLASKDFLLSDLPQNPISSITSITSSLLGAAALSNTTTVSAGSNDDGYYAITLPWNVNYLGTSYSTIYIGTNSYITFGTPATQYVSLNAANPAVPKICISSNDNSWQRVYYGIEGTAPNRTYRVVYEGTASTTGTLGSPTMVWEAVFYENNPSQIDIQIGANARGATGAMWGVYSAEALVGTWPTTSYTNVGFRIVSKPLGIAVAPSPFTPVSFDFSSNNLSLTSGVGYAVTVTAGTDWGSSYPSSSYMGLFKYDDLGMHAVSTVLSTVPVTTTQQYYYLTSVYTPVALTTGNWNINYGSSIELYEFAVNSTEDTYARDTDVAASPTTYNYRIETGTALDSLVGDKQLIPSVNERISGTPVFDTMGESGLGLSVLTSSRYYGQTFVSNYTGLIKTLGFRLALGTTTTDSTNPGYLQLWQLASNSITALPTTLLASVPFYTSDVRNSPTLYLDISSLNVSITSGVGYAVVVEAGSDWNTGSLTPVYYTVRPSYSSPTGTDFWSTYSRPTTGSGSPTISWSIPSSVATALYTYAAMASQYSMSTLDSTNALYLSQTQGYNEPLFATDSITQARPVKAYTGQVHTSSQAPFLSTFTTLHGSDGFSIWGTSFGNLSCGRTFIAGFTGPVSYLEFDLTFSNTGQPAPTQTGYVQLWQLASNSLTALPSTLVGQIAVMPNVANPSGGPVRFDFSSLNITLTSGVGYALAITAGSDWDLTNTQYLAVYGNIDNLYISFNSNPIVRNSNTGVWSIAPAITSNQYNMAVYSTYSTADITDGSPLSYPNMQEQLLANDTNSSLKSSYQYSDAFFNGDAIIETPPYWGSYGGSGGNAGSGYATSFISPKTSLVGEIRVSMSLGSSFSSSIPGSVEIWQLASNSITALPSTQLGSIPVYTSALNTARTILALDFSSQNITLTSGVGYAVVIKTGSDWATTFVYCPATSSAPNEWANFGGYTYYSGTYSVSVYYQFYLSVLPAASNVKDALTYYTTASAQRSETQSALDTPTVARKVPGALVETSSGLAPLFNDYQFSTLSGGGNAMNSNFRQGWGFTATTTGQLGKVSWVRSGTGGYGNYSNGNANPSVSNGALELWQLSGDPGSGVSRLMESIPVAATDFPSTGPSPLWDFSKITGANLVAGISYAVIFSTGSDWSYTTTKTWSIQTQNSGGTDPAAWFGYRMGKAYYYGSGTVGTTTGLTSGYIWDTTTNPSNNAIPPLSIEYATNSIDTPVGGLLISQSTTENVGISATENEIAYVPGAAETVYETGSAGESETNLVAFVSDETETANAQDSLSSQANFYPAVTENVGISATETEDRTLTTTRDVTENVGISATETEINTITTSSSLTENTGISATESGSNIITTTQTVTENTGISATDSETSQADFYPAVTENSGISATDSESNTIVASVQVYEYSNKNLLAPVAEDFSQWAKNVAPNDYTVSTNVTTAPDGSNTADLIIKATTSGSSIVYKVFNAPTAKGQANTQYVGSIYLKAAGYSKVQVSFGNTAFNNLDTGGKFDLTAGTTNTILNGSTVTITSAGNSWWRITVTGTTDADGGNYVFAFTPLDASYNSVFIGDGTSGIYAWGGMVEYGTVASTYIATSLVDSLVGTYTTSSALTETGTASESETQITLQTQNILENVGISATETETAQANFYPAVTENVGISATESENNSIVTNQSTTENVGISATESELGSFVASSILREYNGKNLVETSFTPGPWSIQLSYSLNTAIAPDGTNTALTVTTTGTGLQYIYQGNPIIIQVYPGKQYTFSFYAKLGTLAFSDYKFGVYDEGNSVWLGIDLIPGVTITTSAWNRVIYTFTTPANCTLIRVYPYRNSTITTIGSFYLWGPQLEIGSSATTFANNSLDLSSNIITTTQYTTENVGISAVDSPSSKADFYPAVTENVGISATDGKTASAINLVDITERLLNVTDLSQVQTAFISAIQELLNASESPGTANIVSNRSLTEIVSSIESSTGLPFYAVNINELLNAVVNATTDIPVFITETGSLTAAQLATQLATAGILEQITATEAELSQLILTSYISEISVAGESTVVWIFYPMDYELVSSRPSTLIDIDSDEIYFDNIDVFYLDASNIMADMDVSYDQIYIDNIDVLYGNIALIDSAIADEIYI